MISSRLATAVASICASPLFICAVPFAYGQGGYTLEQCLALAEANNPRIRIAANAVRSAGLVHDELRATGLPQVTAAAGALYAPLPPLAGYDPAITNGGQVAGQIVVRQSLYDAGMRSLKTDQLQVELEKTAHELELARQELRYSVVAAFTEALRAQEEVVLRADAVTQLSAYTDLVRRLYSGGTADYTDLLKTEIQSSGAQLALEKAREGSAFSNLALEEFTGIPPDPDTRFVGVLTDSAGPAPDTTKQSDNLELLIAGLRVQAGELDIQLASHEHLPVVSLVADAGYLTSGENLKLPRSERLNTVGYSIGVGLELPILNWGATGMRVEERELAVDNLRLQRDLVRRSLQTEIQKVLLQRERTRSRLLVLGETIRKAGEQFLLTKSKYAAGGIRALEVLAAQQSLTDTQVDELQARADIRLLNARLERLTAHPQNPARQ